jgi:hypothetical protein
MRREKIVPHLFSQSEGIDRMREWLRRATPMCAEVWPGIRVAGHARERPDAFTPAVGNLRTSREVH